MAALRSVVDWAWKVLSVVLNPIVKRLLRLLGFGGECERLLLAPHDGADLSSLHVRFDAYARRSKQLRPLLPSILRGDTSIIARMVELKRMRVAQPDFARVLLPRLQSCVAEYARRDSILRVIEAAAATRVDRELERHEAWIRDVWRAAFPDEPMPPRTQPQRDADGAAGDAPAVVEPRHTWGDLGFQGRDPATDFRGMGVLGLLALRHFTLAHKADAARILARPQVYELAGGEAGATGRVGWPLALTVIHVTAHTLTLTRTGRLAAAMRNVPLGDEEVTSSNPIVSTFSEAVSALLLAFDDTWTHAAPRSIMDFARVFARFQAELDTKFQQGYNPIGAMHSLPLTRSVSAGV